MEHTVEFLTSESGMSKYLRDQLAMIKNGVAPSAPAATPTPPAPTPPAPTPPAATPPAATPATPTPPAATPATPTPVAPPVTTTDHVPLETPVQQTSGSSQGKGTEPTYDELAFDSSTLVQLKLYGQATSVAKKFEHNGNKLLGIPVYTKSPASNLTFEQSLKQQSGIKKGKDIPASTALGIIGYATNIVKPKSAYDSQGNLRTESPDFVKEKAISEWVIQTVYLPHFHGNKPKEAAPSTDFSVMKLRLSYFSLVSNRNGYPPYLYYNPSRANAPEFSIDPSAPEYNSKFIRNTKDEGGASSRPAALPGNTGVSVPVKRIKKDNTVTPPAITNPISYNPVDKNGDLKDVDLLDNGLPPVADILADIPMLEEKVVTPTQQARTPTPVIPNDVPSPIKPTVPFSKELIKDSSDFGFDDEDDGTVELRDILTQKVMAAMVAKRGVSESEILDVIAQNTANKYLSDLMNCINARLNGASPSSIREKLVFACKGFFRLK